MNIIPGKGVPIKAWTEGVEVEEAAIAQLRNVASLPVVNGLAVMPDVHWGNGATVGSVIVTTNAVIPAAVGVDIGCGMVASKLNIRASDLPDSLAEMRHAIESAVPHGRTDNGGPGDRGAWHNIPDLVVGAWHDLAAEFKVIQGMCPRLVREPMNQLGTLGGGNHFVEVCIDEAQDVWLVLHSGSRGVGNTIGSHFISKAKEEMLRNNVHLPDIELAYLEEGNPGFTQYCQAVTWAQKYAAINRNVMLYNAMRAIERTMCRPVRGDTAAINCHHNYISREAHLGGLAWVTRKGAVHAGRDVMGIIPGSMGTKSYIVRGKGNAESFNSCSHGAGRRMSRGQAKKTFTVEDHIKATEGVECRKDASVLDETPGSYKDIDAVMAAQTDLVEIVHTLKQCLCVKG